MYDVIWRTGCTFTILLLLVLLGSGRPHESPNAAATSTPGGEGTRSAIYGAGTATPEAAAATLAGHEGEPAPDHPAEGVEPRRNASCGPGREFGQTEVCR
jgi:hypothetical protein